MSIFDAWSALLGDVPLAIDITMFMYLTRLLLIAVLLGFIIGFMRSIYNVFDRFKNRRKPGL